MQRGGASSAKASKVGPPGSRWSDPGPVSSAPSQKALGQFLSLVALPLRCSALALAPSHGCSAHCDPSRVSFQSTVLDPASLPPINNLLEFSSATQHPLPPNRPIIAFTALLWQWRWQVTLVPWREVSIPGRPGLEGPLQACP